MTVPLLFCQYASGPTRHTGGSVTRLYAQRYPLIPGLFLDLVLGGRPRGIVAGSIPGFFALGPSSDIYSYRGQNCQDSRPWQYNEDRHHQLTGKIDDPINAADKTLPGLAPGPLRGLYRSRDALLQPYIDLAEVGYIA